MKKLYSQMTAEELEQEMRSIREAMEQAEFPSQRAVLERKWYTAKAYTMDRSRFAPGLYKVEGQQQLFEVAYLNGIMAWGRMGDEPEASFPISMLTRL